VSPNFAHVGRYKSAVETYTRTGFSPDARAATEALLDDLYAVLVDSVAVARGLTPATVRALVDDGPWDASDAVKRGLLDTLMYDADVDSLASRATGRHPTLSFTRYLDRLDEPGIGPHVALVTAAGAIVSGRSRNVPGQGAMLGSETCRGAAPGAHPPLDQGGGAARGQPRRRRRRVGRHLARGGTLPQGEARDRQHVRLCRFGRVLRVGAGRQHRGAAGHDHRLDRRVRRQAQHPRAAPQARAQRGDGVARSACRDAVPVSRLHPEEAARFEKASSDSIVASSAGCRAVAT